MVCGIVAIPRGSLSRSEREYFFSFNNTVQGKARQGVMIKAITQSYRINLGDFSFPFLLCLHFTQCTAAWGPMPWRAVLIGKSAQLSSALHRYISVQSSIGFVSVCSWRIASNRPQLNLLSMWLSEPQQSLSFIAT